MTTNQRTINRPTCTVCGSANITYTTTHTWDDDEQAWFESADAWDHTCGDCKYETSGCNFEKVPDRRPRSVTITEGEFTLVRGWDGQSDADTVGIVRTSDHEEADCQRHCYGAGAGADDADPVTLEYREDLFEAMRFAMQSK